MNGRVVSSIRVPAYIHHKATDTARVRIAGREHSLGRHGSPSSYAKYDRLIAEWRAAGCPTRPVEEEPSIAEIVLGYYEQLLTIRDASRLSNERAALRLLRQRHGDEDAADFGPKALRALQLVMVERGWKRKTIAHRVGIIRAAFKWAVSEEVIDESVWSRLLSVRGLKRGEFGVKEGTGVVAVPPVVIEATLRHLPEMVADMLRIQFSACMRPGEVCAMTRAEVEIDNDRGVAVYRPRHHKTAHHGIGRLIVIPNRATQILLKYMGADGGDAGDGPTDLNAPIFSPARSERMRLAARHAERVTPLSCGNVPKALKRKKRGRQKQPARPPGDRYTPNALRIAVWRACDRAGLPRWSPNQLRHTKATEVRKKHGIEAAQAVLGHRKLETTQVYAEKNAALAMQVALESG